MIEFSILKEAYSNKMMMTHKDPHLLESLRMAKMQFTTSLKISNLLICVQFVWFIKAKMIFFSRQMHAN